MQTISSWIRNQVTNSISNDNNYYSKTGNLFIQSARVVEYADYISAEE